MRVGKLKFCIAALFILLISFFLSYTLNNREIYDLKELDREERGGDFISLSKGVIHYDLSGNAKSEIIVLIHGGTIPMFNWNYQIQDFVKAGFGVLRYDQYGRGLSDRPEVVYNKNLYVDLLKELLDSLKIDKPVNLLGHSFGGSTAIDFSSKYPERVNKLVLFSPMINGISNMLAFNIVRIPIVGKYVAHFFIVPLCINRAENLFGIVADSVEKYHSLFKDQTKYKGFERSLFSMIKSDAMRDYTEEYKVVGKIRSIDALLIWGNKDETVSREMIEKIKVYLPTVTYQEIQNGTHAFNFEEPKMFNKMVLDFLKKDKYL